VVNAAAVRGRYENSTVARPGRRPHDGCHFDSGMLRTGIMARPIPTIRPEREFARVCGGGIVGGVDEAGRGPLAGPVVAACVVWDFAGRRPTGLGDSKKLTERQREKLFPHIQRMALAWGVGISHAAEIDVVNILEATRLASVRAVQEAGARLAAARAEARIAALVTDALDIPALGIPIHPIVKGDAKSASIAAASILAKVTRDRLMDAYHGEFPAYGWDRNRGYPTQDHYDALRAHGPTVLHRLTFNGVGFFCEAPHRSPTFRRLAAMLEGGADAAAVREEAARCGDALPPPDADELARLLGAREQVARPASARPQ